MSNLTEHARVELESLDLFTEEGDFYGGMTGNAVMELIEVFAGQGHSGMSASIVLQLFDRLANFKTLLPLTDDPDEWLHHAPDNWQSSRQGSCFSSNRGKTYIDLDERREWIYRALPWKLYCRLPRSWKYPTHKAQKGS